ncbi:PKD domain-containing protein [Micromonospora inositola]|uniref:PKD domain-containing protein n=1 Tax=Micromonospora inositola TaxID=47865 RepID=A0A1C5HRC2_9ACTN|nr:PKD domain-containing protein [Micromonospora inositola]SCG48498.1 PKD domain-containing protein [Micromonospora inositola]
MRKSSLAGLTALALAGGTLLGAAPAQAVDPAVLHVKQNSITGCSDTWPGTLEQPFCTIGAAAAVVTAGQTVDVGGGNYRERVIITSSGTPDQPITFRTTNYATLIGQTAGFVIDGQHDITIQGLRAGGAVDVPALDLRNASAITVDGGGYWTADLATAPAVRLAGVTRSSLKRLSASGLSLVGGLTMDAATSGVTVTSATVASAQYNTPDHSVGIQVDGPGNRIVNNMVSGFTGAAIAVGPGVADTVVANNQINGGAGYGIHNRGASGTAITNNNVRDRCLDGIRVDGASAGVSVQNNVLAKNGYFSQGYCDRSKLDGVEVGVYDEAVKDTVVDYNNADHYDPSSPTIYAWSGTRMSLAAFREASGQAAHDLETRYARDNYDSANSAAPGYQVTDRYGKTRADDPAVADTGAGPVTYADRGAVETIRPPVASFDLALDLGTTSVEVDASASTPGFVPIASYQFDFGDGTVVTQATPVASHRYQAPGGYEIRLKVTGTDGTSGSRYQRVSLLRRTATVGLLALPNLRYVGPGTLATTLQPNQAGLGTTAQFDLADAGDGQVALFSRATGRYVSADFAGTALLTMTATAVYNTETFTVVRNTDGSISLKSASSNRYVSTASALSPYLSANQTTIGANEKFYRVTVTDANRWLRAANRRYVTAESAGTNPLIASRTTIVTWGRFDVIDLGNGQVALFARANNRFVTADGAGTLPLIAKRGTVGTWERFTLVRNGNGTVSLKAIANGRYVTADGGGAKPLIASRTTIGLYEKFTLG